ncbi:MAG TPA: tetratricopeptide repeat protein [Candidatus Dormibacteraeota bacterium]|nr:tetratricopeptide repeat protein [Candidatus Dormibacteraeota bacterium]
MPDRPAWPSAAPRPTVGPLVGREAEHRALGEILSPGPARLVTLVGMGGVGKSRLAADVAVGLVDAYDGRVAVIQLDRVTDPALLPVTIANALDLGAVEPARLTDRLAETLGGAPTLLVLENLEHLLAAAGLIRRLLDRSPGLAMLVTSRREIGVEGERVVQLEALGVPAADARDPVALAEVPSVALLLADVRRDRPDFALTVHNAAAIGEICRRLDGLPLALELAAGALRVLSPHQLVAQLEERLGRRAAGDRTLPGRQRTLEAAMGWSYDGLDPDVRTLYRRLGVFAGAFSAEAARAVLDAANERGAPSLSIRLDEGIATLAAINLLRVAPCADGDELVMPAAVRLDARRRLDETRERRPVRWAHAYHMLELAEAATSLAARGDRSGFERLAAARDDLRAALEWSAADGRPEFTLRLAGTLGEFWRARGHHTEGRMWLFSAIQRAPQAPAGDRCRALLAEGSLASLQGDYARAGLVLASALELATELGDDASAATILNWLGTNAFGEGLLEAAAARCTEALAIRRRIGDDAGVAASLTALGGIAHFAGDLDRARVLYEESLAIREGLGDASNIALTLAHIGLVDRDRGAPLAAIASLDKAAGIWERSADRQRLAVVRHDRALVALDLGDTTRAVADLGEVLAEARALGDRALLAHARADIGRAEAVAAGRDGDADAVEGRGKAVRAAREHAAEAVRLAIRANVGPVIPLALDAAGMAAAGDEDVRAARLWGAATRARERTGLVIVPADAALLERCQAAVRLRLGDERWAAETAAGRELDPDDALLVAQAASPGEPDSADPLAAGALAADPLAAARFAADPLAAARFAADPLALA